jgi:hypothetical protein
VAGGDRRAVLAGMGPPASSPRRTSRLDTPMVGSSTRAGGDGPDQEMTVTAEKLPAPGPDQYYEVWLLDPGAGTVLSVGVLPPDGHARFTLPASVVGRYRAIDVSLEADDGDPTHSRRSLLRAATPDRPSSGCCRGGRSRSGSPGRRR